MIKIRKPSSPPKILAPKGRGRTKRRSMCLAYNRGQRTFELDSGVYADRAVKEALKQAQHGKCCFCEAKITHISYGDVEHFRPKAGFRQEPGQTLQTPGYYWLAYEWRNLLLSCQLCNQCHKKNLFPLLPGSVRARCHRDDLRKERPAFINPAEEDPARHISFRQEIPYPLTRRGRATIDALGLDRDALNEERRAVLEYLRNVHLIARLSAPFPEGVSQEDVDDARACLQRAVNDSAAYAAMARAAVAAGFARA